MRPVSVLHPCPSQIRLSCLTSKLPSSVTHSIETSSRQIINECSQRILVVTSSGSNGVFFDASRPAMLACDGPMLTSCACTVPATKATNRTTTVHPHRSPRSSCLECSHLHVADPANLEFSVASSFISRHDI